MFSTEVMLWALTIFNFAAVSCAVWAAIMANSSLKALRKKLAERATRSLRQLDVAVAECESTLSSLTSTMRRLSSRTGMRDLRERRREESSSTSLHTATKAQLRLMLQTGQARVIDGNPRLNGGASPAQTAPRARTDADADDSATDH